MDQILLAAAESGAEGYGALKLFFEALVVVVGGGAALVAIKVITNLFKVKR